MGENGFEIILKYMYILKIKSTYLNALLSFLLSSRFSNRSDAFLASFSFFGFLAVENRATCKVMRLSLASRVSPLVINLLTV